MAQKKVLILGASRYYVLGIEAARKAGYYIIAVDKNQESEGFKVANDFVVCDIIDKEGILKIAQKFKVDGIVPVNDWGVPTAAYVSTRLDLHGISEESAEYATSKRMMRKIWIEKGIPCPRVEMGISKKEIIYAIGKIGFPCILKPANGIGGASRGVIVIQNAKEIDSSIDFSQKFYDDKTTLIESFIIAEYEHSAEVLIYNGIPEVIAISDKIKGELPFRVDKNVLYPSIIEGKKLDQLRGIIIESVLALGINRGAAHVELATTKDGFVLFELGARCGGGGTSEPIVPFVSGVNEFVELVRILTGDTPINLKPISKNGCNYHFLTFRPGKIKRIEGFEKIKNHNKVLDAELFVHEGQIINQVTCGLERSGFFITGCDTREEAYSLGVELENQLNVIYE